MHEARCLHGERVGAWYDAWVAKAEIKEPQPPRRAPSGWVEMLNRVGHFLLKVGMFKFVLQGFDNVSFACMLLKADPDFYIMILWICSFPV